MLYKLLLLGFISSSYALVGGFPLGKLNAVFIWTYESESLTSSYCTGSKVGEKLILTAAHCVLSQLPASSKGNYYGPWKQTLFAGESIKYSFIRNTKNLKQFEKLKVKNLHLPEQVLSCLKNPDSSVKLCQNRTPLPDLAIIELDQTEGSFADKPKLELYQDHLRIGQQLIMMGYGSETNAAGPKPRLKLGVGALSAWSNVTSVLEDTYASVDGMPSGKYFFAVLSPMNSTHHLNLGSGDSGGPILDYKTAKVVGVNSDGFCFLGDRYCQETNNSLFARLDKKFLKVLD